ncbi:MAG: hypothetical protein R3F30_05565 [Planctomycetota bacterium]
MRWAQALLLGALLAGAAAGQDGGAGQGSLDVFFGRNRLENRDDKTYWVVEGGFRLRIGDLRVGAERAVLVMDRDEFAHFWAEVQRPRREPVRDLLPPFAQERDLARERLERLREAGRGFGPELETVGRLLPEHRQRLALLLRGLRAEGQVFFEQAGVRNLRCDRLWLSLVSDRAVLEGVEARFPVGTALNPGPDSFVLTAPRMVKQGRRLVAYGGTLSTCDAGEPHYRLTCERLVVTMQDDATAFEGKGNRLEVQGLPAVPLPNFTYYSDQQNLLPVRGFRAGVSDNLGWFALVEFGGRWNGIGQALVDLFHDGPERFRGEWRLETGYSEKRGAPFDGGLTYALPGSFFGMTEGFYLDDRGQDVRAPTRDLSGAAIVKGERSFQRSDNRIELWPGARLDLQAFKSSDQGAYLEFRPNALKGREQSETSADLRFRDGQAIVAVTGRTNLDDWQYDTTVRQTDTFREELPYARAGLYSMPLFEPVDGVPFVIDGEVGQGVLQNRFDASLGPQPEERSYRSDVRVEASMPFRLGPWAVRPAFEARDLYYTEDRSGGSGDRLLLTWGLSLSTRFFRDFEDADPASGALGLRHEILPEVRVYDTFRSTGSPTDYWQFDDVDALEESARVDVVLLNRLRHMLRGGGTLPALQEFVWLDLVQQFYPDKTRDNGGELLGLFEWELLIRSDADLLGIPGLRILFEGEHDWALSRDRTRNVGLGFSPWGGADIAGEWRSGLDGDGTGSLAFGTSLWRRWRVSYGVLWSFERDELQSQNVTLMRNDHDWTFLVSVQQDELAGDTSFRFQFVPRMLGLDRSQRESYIGGDPAFGVRNVPTR